MNDETSALARRVAQLSVMLFVGMLTMPLLAAPPNPVNFTVKVFPRQDGTVEIETGPQGKGAASKGRGYMGYDENEAGWTTFQVKRQNPYLTCADDNGQGPSPWVITGLRLSDTGGDVYDAEKGTTQQRGSDFGGPVDEAVWQSFMLVDRDTGVLFEADKDTSQSYLQVYNRNMLEAVVYYQLELTRCRDGHVAVADPAWGNGGRTR